jgi:hypothetical protein
VEAEGPGAQKEKASLENTNSLAHPRSSFQRQSGKRMAASLRDSGFVRQFSTHNMRPQMTD